MGSIKKLEINGILEGSFGSDAVGIEGITEEQIQGGRKLTITMTDGESHDFNIMDGAPGEDAVVLDGVNIVEDLSHEPTDGSGHIPSAKATWDLVQPIHHDAEDIDYDNTESGIEATNVQDALDELAELAGRSSVA